jgi:hypothetical protein
MGAAGTCSVIVNYLHYKIDENYLEKHYIFDKGFPGNPQKALTVFLSLGKNRLCISFYYNDIKLWM